MNIQDKKEMNHLLSLMKPADKAYWVDNKNIMTDGEYDTLYMQLKKLHQKYPSNQTMNTYFATMHHDTNNSFKKIKHRYHAISLDKIRDRKSVSEFLNKWSLDKNSKYYTDGFLVESKDDGLSFFIYFNDDRMPHKITCLTRGSGVYGNDVTNEIYHFNNMNIRKIAKKVGNRHVVIRGEALISHRGFNYDNKMNGNQFKNERNLVSGTVMNKDPKTVGERKVFLSAYTLLNHDEYSKALPTELDQMKFMRDLGFSVVTNVRYFPNTPEGKKDAMHFIFDFSHQQRTSLGYDTDGLVIKPNYTVNYTKIGWNKHGAKFQKAYKFPPSRALANVKTVKYQVSAMGKLTPVIIFKKPVKIFGATISKCTGGSVPDMKKYHIMINGYVTVKRMNDVIPKAFGLESLSSHVKNLELPTATLPKDAIRKGPFYYIPKDKMNNSLPVVLNRWSKLVSKPCLNIMGLSDKMIRTLIKYKLIDPHDFSSLWRINHDDFIKTPSFAEKGWKNLQAQLKKAKSTPLAHVLLGLPINSAGLSLFDPISKRLGNFKNLLGNQDKCDAMKNKLLKEIPAIKGLGQSAIPVINRIFSPTILKQLSNLAPYLDLKDNQPSVPQNTNGKLKGLHFCITGKLAQPRKHYTQVIKQNSGKMQSSVNGKTDYLICNQASHSSKYRSAIKHHTKIITEKQFDSLLK